MSSEEFDPDEMQLLILSSPSGAGKSTLTRELMQDQLHQDLAFSVSHMTRKPRQNEVDGQHYHFTDIERFVAMRDEGAFAEWAEVHGNYYGTAKSELARAKAKGKSGLLFDVDYQGARQIKATFPRAVGVFILPPSLEELRRRLEGRGTDDAATIARRFDKAREEIEHYPFFDYLVVNDDLNRALAELKGIVHAERCRRFRKARAAEALLRS